MVDLVEICADNIKLGNAYMFWIQTYAPFAAVMHSGGAGQWLLVCGE